ncbi:hypothetical protein V7S43_013790 [Phytophthora oleae]|uniref:Uncharacterized protein n=1 Tax=Phytophthora oleae TaxID=2107226 RepID=A0ABD3F333_9STRA
MRPRRTQTHQLHDAFMAKLDGKSPAERLGLLSHRKKYLDGERDDDVVVDALSAPTRTPAPVLAPPRGKAASSQLRWPQKTKKSTKPRRAAKVTEPAAPPQSGKKKMTKKKAAEIAREEKKAKKARGCEAR